MLRRCLQAVATSLVVTLLALVPTGAANASRTTVPDSEGDQIGGPEHDILAIEIVHRRRVLLIKVHSAGTGIGAYQVAIDVGKGDTKPDFGLSWKAEATSVAVTRMKDWGLAGRERCQARAASLVGEEITTVAFTIPRRCLTLRGRLQSWARVNVESINVDAGTRADVAPTLHAFSDWVTVGPVPRLRVVVE